MTFLRELIVNPKVVAGIQRLFDEGSPIEAGWGMFKEVVCPTADPVIQESYREAFMAGAVYLYQAAIIGLTEGDEVTDNDERRIESLNKEISTIVDAFNIRHAPAN
jgi:hypothetical protein